MTILIGAIIGLVLGLTGAGGSVLAVPLLVVFLHLSAAQATGLALGVVAASSLFGALGRIIERQVLWIPVLLFGASGVVFAPVGRLLSNLVSQQTLTLSFVILSVIIALRMAWQSWHQREQAVIVRAHPAAGEAEPLLCRFSESQHFDWRFRCMAGLTVGGVLTGLLSGFFGVGGGFLIVPFLNQLNSVSMRQAVSTSLVIIAGISLSGFATELLTADVDLSAVTLLALGGIVGMIGGTLLAKHVAGVVLQRIFAATIIGMAALLLTRGF